MHPLQNGSQETDRPEKKPLSGQPGWFTESGENNVPSYPGQDWFNSVIAEFLNSLSILNINFDPSKEDHLARAFSYVSDKVEFSTLKSLTLDGGADNTGEKYSTDSFNIDDSFFVPGGRYKSLSGFSKGRYDFSPESNLLDVLTSLPYKPAHNGTFQALDDAFLDKTIRSLTGWKPKISCFGDSNTRYYEGENGGDGPFAKSYGEILNLLCGYYPSTFGATVDISGHPGFTANWASSEIGNYVDSDSDIVIIGFGTNDIKTLNAPSEAELNKYLDNMISMILHVLSLDAIPIILGIPWFSETYGENGITSQRLIKVWNSHLLYLCNSANIPFIDTYNLTREETDVYFNESNVKRHYSQAATKAIAERVLSEIINHSCALKEKAYVFNTFDYMPYARGSVASLTKHQYTLAHERFEALRIPNGESIQLSTHGLTCVGFYPRSTATAVVSVDGDITNISIQALTDKGLYYPIIRHSIGAPSLSLGDDKSVTITADGGDVYIRYFSFESNAFTTSSTAGHGNVTIYSDISALDLPVSTDDSVIYRITELTGTPAYLRSGGWYAYDGLLCVGDDTDMQSVLTVGAPNGKKFYNITQNQRFRLIDGSWITW